MEAKRIARVELQIDRAPAPLNDPADPSDALGNIRRLATSKARPPEPSLAASQGQRHGAPDEHNLRQALDLIHRDVQAQGLSGDRVREAEARARALAERAIKEVRAIEARLRAAETSLWEAEARAEAAEQHARDLQVRAEAADRRSKEAEEWLGRFHSAILSRFSS